jgi:two-component system, chemotaxis family, chemotaxis protein CheY
LQRKKILVVDDARIVRQQVGMALKGAGFEVLEAEDGATAVELVGTTLDLALVVCDVNMPGMSGIDFLETLAASGRISSLPVVILTTEVNTALVTRAKSAGAKAWMVKPFNPSALISTAKRLTGLPC